MAAAKRSAGKGAKKAARKPAAKKPTRKPVETRRATKPSSAKKVAAKKAGPRRSGTAGKADGRVAVEAWIAGVKPEHRAIVERVDRIVSEAVPDVRHAIKWSTPMFGRAETGWFAAVASFKAHVGINFFNGVALEPQPKGGEGKGMRSVRIESLDDLDEKQLREWMRQAAPESRLGQGLVTSDDARVDPDIARARTLPPEAFTSEAFLERELATVFRRHWLLLPMRASADLRDDPRSLAEMVRTRGARAPVSVNDRPLFVQRDWDGGLHMFPNVCTHAWHTLVPGPSRERSIRCPQHGREFDCLGKFVHQPGIGKAEPEDDLADLPVRAWGDLLFGALGAPAHAFEAALAPVLDSIRFDVGALRRMPLAGEVRELDGNWKQHAWNYMDSLHIPYIHKKPGGLADAVDMASYRTELHGLSALQWAYARDPAHGFDPALLHERFASDAGKRVFALWWFVFPNLTLNFYPWGLSINVYAPVPGKPQRTLFHWYHLALDPELYARRESIWMMREVDDEDVDALTQVARGVRSGFATRGRFAGEAEKGPHWFHRMVADEVR